MHLAKPFQLLLKTLKTSIELLNYSTLFHCFKFHRLHNMSNRFHSHHSSVFVAMMNYNRCLQTSKNTFPKPLQQTHWSINFYNASTNSDNQEAEQEGYEDKSSLRRNPSPICTLKYSASAGF